MQFTFELFGKTYSGETLAEVSALFSAARDKSGRGSSSMPLPEIKQDSDVVGHFSYNGRVWSEPSKNWKPGSLPIFDNAAA